MSDAHHTDVDVVVAGAGFAGLYAAYRLRRAGHSMRIFEAGDDIGGTWYWNRYPGARVDIPSVDYMYSFDPDWSRDWQWSEKYATQPEILRYLNHVADKHDLRRDIQFGTRVTHAHWDDDTGRYRVRTDRGDEITCRYLIMATGCLSVPKDLDIDGIENFTGELYFTSRWPHEPVDFTGETGRCRRHRLIGHPIDPADRRPGRAGGGVPTNPLLLDPRPQRPDLPGQARPIGRRRRLPSRGAILLRRGPDGALAHSDILGVRRRTSTTIRTRLAAR